MVYCGNQRLSGCWKDNHNIFRNAHATVEYQECKVNFVNRVEPCGSASVQLFGQRRFYD